jgi:hypothetical protein
VISEAFLRYRRDGEVLVRWNGRSPDERREYSIEDEKLANALGQRLPEHLADLVDLAMAVYVADRLVPRRSPGQDRFARRWRRSLTLELPIRCLSRWQQPEVGERLQECLDFLTEDDWSFTFVRREQHARSSETQGFLLPTDLEPPIQVALFSGGLDSLAGAEASLQDPAPGTLILLGGVTNRRLNGVIETLVRDLREVASRDLRALLLPLNLRQPGSRYNSNERSQRSRGFLYGVLGAVAAAMADGTEVLFYENGIGAINLRYSPAQFGTHSTRATNPVALASLSEFLESYLQQPLRFRLPNLFSTKAEMCSRLTTSPLRSSIERTVTCDGFPRREKTSQCGYCTSCLLRRQSLWAAGLEAEDPGGLYSFDLVNPSSDWSDKRWHLLRAMLGQVDTFRRGLATSSPWDALAGEYPMLKRVAWSLNDQGMPLETAKARLLGLLGRYSAEWEQFPAMPPGWQFGPLAVANDWRFRDVS